MSTSVNNLSREKIQQLLAAIGSEKTEDNSQIETTEYNWHQPHCFSTDQLNKLNNFTEKVALMCAEKLSVSYHGSFDVTIASTDLLFAHEFLKQNQDDNQNNHYLAFGTDQNQSWGLITIPPQTAIIWTTQLLGDSEVTEEAARDLSQLEESLLLDIASVLVKALSDSHGSYELQPAPHIVKGLPPLKLQGTEELCKITFNIKKTGSENSSEAHFVLPCSKLQNVVGKTQAENKSSAEDVSKSILDHLHEMKISVTAELSSTVLTFQEIVSLQVDDILLLDKKIDEPVDVLVESQKLFKGQPAKSTGKYAVAITSSQFQ